MTEASKADVVGSADTSRQVPQEELTLAEFLLARTDDDRIAANEELLHRSRKSRLRRWDGPFDPWRTLAECDAKRRILQQLASMEARRSDFWDDDEWTRYITLKRCCGELAAIHSDHPDYRQEWKP